MNTGDTAANDRAVNDRANGAETATGLMDGYGAPAYGPADKRMPRHSPEKDYAGNSAGKARTP